MESKFRRGAQSQILKPNCRNIQEKTSQSHYFRNTMQNNKIKLSKGEGTGGLKTKISHSIKGKEFAIRFFTPLKKSTKKTKSQINIKYIRSYTTSSLYKCIYSKKYYVGLN